MRKGFSAENHAVIPVITAAGESRRMGYPKILAMLGKRNFGQHILHSLRKAGFEKIIMVLGSEKERIFPVFSSEPGLTILTNNNFSDGPLSSIKTALKTLNRPQPVMIFPVDHPLVSSDLLQQLAFSHLKFPDRIIIPVFQEKRGHPVIFAADFFNELLNAPLDQGARYVTRLHQDRIYHVKTQDSGILLNINTEEQLCDIAKLPDNN